MPLSEEEQKMLEEIERNFYDNDPTLAKSVRAAMVDERPSRSGVVGVAGIVGGLVLVVVGLSRHVAFSYLGFLAMVAGALSLEQHLRHFATEALRAITERLAETQGPQVHRRVGQKPAPPNNVRDRRRKSDTDEPDR